VLEQGSMELEEKIREEYRGDKNQRKQ